MVFRNKWIMKKIIILLVLGLFIFTSCSTNKTCAAYGGEKSKWQKNYK